MERIGTYEWTVILIGIGTVFAALIGLSLVLGIFSLFSRIGSGKPSGASIKGKPGEPEIHPAASGGVTPELVAVITAAVSAASGMPASSFRIARVTPSTSGIPGINTPVWGCVNRLTRTAGTKLS